MRMFAVVNWLLREIKLNKRESEKGELQEIKLKVKPVFLQTEWPTKTKPARKQKKITSENKGRGVLSRKQALLPRPGL